MGQTMLDAAALKVLADKAGTDVIHAAQALLPRAAALAVVPVSDFYVGAIAIDQAGNAWFGANQEFAGMPLGQTIHAEQSAIAHAWMGGATQIVHMIVTHTPCGHCRQFMSELHGADTLCIHLPHLPATPLDSYLPERFGPADLGIKTGLMYPVQHRLFAAHADDELGKAALSAAQESHAPYSGAHAGFTLRSRDGRIFAGRYAENAAYNPSLPALQCALNLLHLHGMRAADIVEGVLVYQPGQGHERQTEMLWQMLTDAPLRLVVAEAGA